jgi:glycine C-acetyltransferase/8-amino-7-oxononanoate synthase
MRNEEPREVYRRLEVDRDLLVRCHPRLVVGDPDAAMAVTARALEQGVFAQAIRPPTVPEGTSRLRVVATAAHAEEDLRAAAATLAAAAHELGLAPAAA